MKKDKHLYLLYYNHPECRVFCPEEDLYLGTDGLIHIGACEEEVFGTGDACEGYYEDNVNSESDIKNFFKNVASIETYDSKKTVIDKDNLIDNLILKYRDLVRMSAY